MQRGDITFLGCAHSEAARHLVVGHPLLAWLWGSCPGGRNPWDNIAQAFHVGGAGSHGTETGAKVQGEGFICSKKGIQALYI